MGLSLALLLIAIATAAVPTLGIALRPPRSVRDLEKLLVVAVATVTIGTFAASRFYTLDRFGLAHLVYLLLVVTVPTALGSWFLLSIVRQEPARLLRFGAGVGALLAVAGVWATHIEPNWLRVDRATTLAAVPTPLTIGVMADLQTPNVGDHEWNAVNTLIDEGPDIVVLPGDLFQGDSLEIEARSGEFTSLLSALVSNIEIVAVVSGDSDHADQLAPIVASAGALFLDNRVVTVEIDGQPVRLAGVTVASGPERLTTLADLTEPSDAYTVLVSHRPDTVFELPRNSDVDLIVSGHTHGGQIALPFVGPPFTLSDVPRDLAAGGLGTVDNFVLYVSTGVGLERRSAPQVRFGVRPSVGIIDVLPR